MKVLHLTPHLGGGVGTVLRSYLSYVLANSLGEHMLFSLESINEESKIHLKNIGCKFVENAFSKNEELKDAISASDVVLVHWWNHPLLQHFLMNVSIPDSRLVFWSHISGSTAPNNFSQYALGYPDRFIFTTPLSYFVNEIKIAGIPLQQRLGCIWSTAGVERLTVYHTETKISDLKEISYVGNLDYTKVHKDFLKLCSDLIKRGKHVNVIGPTTKDFLGDLEELPTSTRPNVYGYVDEVTKFELLSKSRIFGYPLARHNYATCDQALQEAMFFGVVPVVLNNPMESYMVKHGTTGLVARSPREYLEFVEELAENNTEYERLRDNSRRFANEAYSIQRMARSWDSEFHQMLSRAKKKRKCLREVKGREIKASEVFIESLASSSSLFQYHFDAATIEDRSIAESQIRCLSALPQWSSTTKSTPSHYAGLFKDDAHLSEWARLTRYSIDN
jgi:glycosyltransferase involved in cell wall biosynthesis